MLWQGSQDPCLWRRRITETNRKNRYFFQDVRQCRYIKKARCLHHFCPQDLKTAKVFVIVVLIPRCIRTDFSQVLELTPLKWLGIARSFYITSLSPCPPKANPSLAEGEGVQGEGNDVNLFNSFAYSNQE